MSQNKILKPLPVGESDLDKILNNDFIYIDKTKHVYDLVKLPGKYFLSRPRRFGKSTLISTFYEIFRGNRELFKDLWIYNSDYKWDEYSIIRIDFNEAKDVDLIEYIRHELKKIAIRHDVFNHDDFIELSYSQYFRGLLDALYQKYQRQVVVLIDEYDKPILDVIEDLALAEKKRDILKGFYGVMKGVDEYLRFVFLTGVSKFSKVGIFSGLNNLNDISLDYKYADICGYNQNELNKSFSQYLSHYNIDQQKLKQWYNGYNFGGDLSQCVYNPFDILLFFDKGCIYQNYWFETATPSFLIKMIQKYQYFFPNLESIIINSRKLSSFEIDDIDLVVLLFQTGYLTIKNTTTIGTQLAYELSYPNLEVKASLNDSLAEIGISATHKNVNISKLDKCLKSNNIDSLKNVIYGYFASIPHDWYRNNNIDNYEGFYASIVYSYFCALGYELIAEDTTNFGKIDLTIKMYDKILIVEFKLSKYGKAIDAINQLKNNKYADKYKTHNIPIYLIGISFDPNTRNVDEMLWECV